METLLKVRNETIAKVCITYIIIMLFQMILKAPPPGGIIYSQSITRRTKDVADISISQIEAKFPDIILDRQNSVQTLQILEGPGLGAGWIGVFYSLLQEVENKAVAYFKVENEPEKQINFKFSKAILSSNLDKIICGWSSTCKSMLSQFSGEGYRFSIPETKTLTENKYDRGDIAYGIFIELDELVHIIQESGLDVAALTKAIIAHELGHRILAQPTWGGYAYNPKKYNQLIRFILFKGQDYFKNSPFSYIKEHSYLEGLEFDNSQLPYPYKWKDGIIGGDLETLYEDKTINTVVLPELVAHKIGMSILGVKDYGIYFRMMKIQFFRSLDVIDRGEVDKASNWLHMKNFLYILCAVSQAEGGDIANIAAEVKSRYNKTFNNMPLSEEHERIIDALVNFYNNIKIK